ncbi:hypothetical protein GF337_11680 [candidate division KSB1 bacterium]|nr:hypothetical protein [candidate division KSB1 bacterium]
MTVMDYKNQRGGIYIITMFMMIVLLILGMSLIQLASVNKRSVIIFLNQTKAHYIAEAGIEHAVVNFVLKNSFRNLSEYQSERIIHRNKLGDGYYTVFLLDGTESTVAIQSTGFCNGAIKNVNVRISVNWENKAPCLTSFRYQVPVSDSLLMIY